MEFNKYKERGAYHWKDYGRDPIYTGHVDKVLEWVTHGNTLDVGAGDGLITYHLDAEGIDNNELAVKLARDKGARVTLGSAYNLPNKHYDNILLLDVLEHLERPLDTLEQIRSRADYLYIVTPPARKDGRVQDKYHYKEWTEAGLIELVEYELMSIETIPEYVRMYAKFNVI